MGNIETHDLSPRRDEERKELNISRSVNYKQYCKHVEGRPREDCLHEVTWHLRDSISMYERLNASFNAITEIPNELPLRLPHLSYINFSHNQIEVIPDSFGLLFHLKTLILKFNKIKTLPESFFYLEKLEKLDISHNDIKKLTCDIEKFSSLSKLNISSNKLKCLPFSLGGMRSLTILLASDNRFQGPLLDVSSSSENLLCFMRKNYKLSGKPNEPLATSFLNVFQRVRGNNLHTSVPNPHSAQVQYIQSQTHTTNTPSRIKTPLLPPHDATTLDSDILSDRILGLIYGAAIGDALGLATCSMSPDECRFHYDTDMIHLTDIVQDEVRVRWRHGDWTSNFDTMVLLLDSIIAWAGVIDELDYAKRLHKWCMTGFPELGDRKGVILSETVKLVTEHSEFCKDPHTSAKDILERNTVHVYAIENGVIHSEDEASSVSSEHSNISDVLNGPILFPSSHPCIPSKKFGTDNGAIVQIAVLGKTGAEDKDQTAHVCRRIFVYTSYISGIPFFHLPNEVEANTLRICKSTHNHPFCVASCVVITHLVSLMLQGKHDLHCKKSIEEMVKKAVPEGSKHILNEDQTEEFLKYSDMLDLKSIECREQYNMSYTLKAMAAGLVALRSQKSFKSFLMALAFHGGDSNSNACVAGALLGCKYGYSHLCQDWLGELRKKQAGWLNVKVNHLLDMIGLP